MINIENSAKLNNSISYNVINYDLVAKNYLALAYCIAGVKLKNKRIYTGITTTCRAFGLLENSNKSSVKETESNLNLEDYKGYKKRSDMRVIVTDTVTNEDIIYSSSKEAIEKLGIQSNRIHNYIYNGTRYKGIYLIRYEDMPAHEVKPTRQKKVKCINEKTGEVIIKDSMKEAANYLGIRQDHMTYLAREGKKTKAGWRVEKI